MNTLLPPECKFAVLAISSVRADVPAGLNLPGGIQVLNKFPIDLDAQWRSWLGLEFSNISSANLVLVRTTNVESSPETLTISDSTNTGLAAKLADFFSMLRLLGTIEYESAFLVTGYTQSDRTVCQNYSKLVRYHFTRGCLPWMVRAHCLTAAADLVDSKASLFANFPDLHRVRLVRGWLALNTALQQYYASDRIHGFVRALEALIRPTIGNTKGLFMHRCSLFAAPSTQQPLVQQFLREAYEMRSAVEHIHDWDHSLEAYDVADRENIAYWRTRQMETLACTAYVRIFKDQAIQKEFCADQAIDQFWQKPDHEIRAALGHVCNINDLRCVRKYDAAGRAQLSEWPDGWLNGLTERHFKASAA